MKTITEYLKQKNNLLPLSAWITLGIMTLIFIIAQILTFTGLLDDLDLQNNKMEVRELVKLKFAPKIGRESVKSNRNKMKRGVKKSRNLARTENKPSKAANKSSNFTALVQGFDKKQFMSSKASAAKRGTIQRANRLNAGISTEANRNIQAVADFKISGHVGARDSNSPVARRSAAGGNQSTRVGIGGGSNFGNGVGGSGYGTTGAASAGRGASRSTRGSGSGAGAAKISMPSGSGGNEAALDLHELIKWMKAHPGAIPKLVAHDMGHQTRDLSSAVIFKMRGRQYRLFLSCNEKEQLLRICLVEKNEFTLLKDNGIRETSNFLTLGSVVRERSKIRSLISSRRAPAGKAKQFYQIFWSWWLHHKS